MLERIDGKFYFYITYMSNIKIILAVVLILVVIIFLNYANIRINLIVFLIINRGLIAPNCFWWNIANLLTNDGSGINFGKCIII